MEKDSEKLVHEEPDVPEIDASDEEKSEFFNQWKERHQAYLASLESEKTPEKEEANEKKPLLFKGRKKEKTRKEDSQKTEQYSKFHLLDEQKKTKPPIPTPVLLKALPILILSVFSLLVSLFFISPASKQKSLVIEGNQVLTSKEIENLSLISPKDYALTIALNSKGYAENIKKSSPWVQSANMIYHFPNQFTIQIKEYRIIGYLQQGDSYFSVLSSGEVLETPFQAEELPEQHLFINITDNEMVKQLVLQLDTIDSDILAGIQKIDLTPSKVTSDLLTLTMADENTILVPLSEIDVKLPYYKKIAETISEPSIIDMEVGIFRYSSY